MDQPIGLIFAAFCSEMHVSKNLVRFLYEGNQVLGTDTPSSLNMNDSGDIIRAIAVTIPQSKKYHDGNIKISE